MILLFICAEACAMLMRDFERFVTYNILYIKIE